MRRFERHRRLLTHTPIHPGSPYCIEVTARVRLTKAQHAALKAYQFAEAQEDRYLGSVFVTPRGQDEYRAKTLAAYEACKRLGMGVEHGL